MKQKIFNIIILLSILYLLARLNISQMETKREFARIDRYLNVISLIER